MKEFVRSQWEVRVTAPINVRTGQPKMTLYYPWGMVFTHDQRMQRHEFWLDGPDGLVFDFDGRNDEYIWVTDMTGEPMYKFVTPTKPSLEYHKFIFWRYGSQFTIEIRKVADLV